MSDRSKTTGETEDTAMTRLLRFAGRGPRASAETRARVYATVSERWRETTRTTAPSRAEPGYLKWALAATVAATAVGIYLLQSTPLDSHLEFAAIDKIVGTVQVIRDESVIELDASLPDLTLATGDELRTSGEGRIALRLVGGGALRVDSDSAISIDAMDRMHLARGTVYFDSDGDQPSPNPFRIQTDLGMVTHVGTQYEASFGAAGLRIRVREGAIRFEDEARELTGMAGDELLLSESGDVRRSTIPRDDPAWQWTTDLATIEEQSEYALIDILGWIAREGGMELRFADPQTQAQATATVLYGFGGLSPEEALEVIDGTTELAVSRSAGSLLVARP